MLREECGRCRDAVPDRREQELAALPRPKLDAVPGDDVEVGPAWRLGQEMREGYHVVRRNGAHLGREVHGRPRWLMVRRQGLHLDPGVLQVLAWAFRQGG